MLFDKCKTCEYCNEMNLRIIYRTGEILWKTCNVCESPVMRKMQSVYDCLVLDEIVDHGNIFEPRITTMKYCKEAYNWS